MSKARIKGGINVAEIEVKGLSDLAKALKELPAEIASRNGGPLARSLAKAARVIRHRAQQLAPSAPQAYKVGGVILQPGRLKESIRAVRVRKPDTTEQYVVKPFSKQIRKKYGFGANYWHLIEFGFTHENGETIGPRSFLSAAYESEKTNALGVFKKGLALGIERARKKIYKKKNG